MLLVAALRYVACSVPFGVLNGAVLVAIWLLYLGQVGDLL